MRLRLTPLVVFASVAWGCLDLPPRIVVADAAAPDDGETPTPDAGPSPCMECIMSSDEAPGCGTAWGNCKDEPRCVGLVECTDQLRCFRISELSAFLSCTQPCVEKYMLAGSTDPVYPLVTPIVFCTTGTGACVPICSGN